MDRPEVWVVDDDEAVGQIFVSLLQQAGYRARYLDAARRALAELRSRSVDLILTDLRMPDMDGMTLLEQCRSEFPDLPIVMITAHGSVDTAVEAMKRGAVDFVNKPVDREELLHIVEKSLQVGSTGPSPDGDLVGSSAPFRELLAKVDKVADSRSTVLLLGESGTGKERIAQRLHERSRRSGGPFVVVDCGALPETLIEAELFGHVEGAFTGAVGSRPGRVVLAHEGTLFLDEVGELPPHLQVKLLRLLQERELQPVGSDRVVSVDIRVVVATNKDLSLEVQNGRFREDLFYRLAVVPCVLPPLRDRDGDVRALSLHFVQRAARDVGRDAVLAEDAIAALEAHPWPGNIRELENVIERLVLLAEGTTITGGDVRDALAPIWGASPPPASPPAPTAPGADELNLEERRRAAELDVIRRALDATNGHHSRAARVLGISRRTLHSKMREYGVD